jgi:hypothetical protein
MVQNYVHRTIEKAEGLALQPALGLGLFMAVELQTFLNLRR